MPGIDVLVVSAGSTEGWRTAAAELTGAIERSGASAVMVTAEPPRRVRTFALTDLMQARAARRAAIEGIDRHDPQAVIYCSITASLLWPRPGAIFLDSIAAENRRGRHGVWQRPVERRRLRDAPMLLPWSERSLEPLNGPHAEAVVVRVPVEALAPGDGSRDIAAITYAGDPVKRRLPNVLDAWRRARRDGEKLVVTGIPSERLEALLGAVGVPSGDGVEIAGQLTREEFRAQLARARTFIAAPRLEDYGIAALEALASGCMLISTPSPGPYPALELGRELDPRLIGDDLAGAVRIALDDPRPGYAERAGRLLEPFGRAAMERTVAERVLPRLLNR